MDDQKLDVRIGQAAMLAVLSKPYRTGVFRARNDEERVMRGRLDALLNPSDEPQRPAGAGDLERLGGRDCIDPFEAFQSAWIFQRIPGREECA